MRENRTSREWLLRMADAEARYESVAVGGLAATVGFVRPTSPSPVPWVFGRLIEFARRARGLTVERLAREADVDLGELVVLERDGGVIPKPRTVYQLAQVLGLSAGKLMELSGLAESKDPELEDAALRFAARSEPSAKLSKEERQAFEEFVGVLAKASD
jgi:transcriptional regulator with XRE-family HTH domain